MSKILIDVCDRCSKPEGISLHSEDGRHHLCGDCVLFFLASFFDPSRGRFTPVREGEETSCVFCGGVWLDAGKSTPFVFRAKNDVRVCDTCLLRAARKMGSLRIVRDC